MRKYYLILFLFSFVVNLFSQVNFEFIFDFEEPATNDYLRNIWIDDLDNNGDDEMYVLYTNHFENNWKICCLDLNGNDLWNHIDDYPNDFISLRNGLLFSFNNSLYLATVFSRCDESQEPYDAVIYSDLKIYNWNDYTLIDSISVLIGNCLGVEGYRFYVNQINPIVVDNALNLYIGEQIRHGWGSWIEGFYETRNNIINRFSFDNNTLVLEDTIINAGSKLLHYDDYNSLISFCINTWSYTDNMGNSSMGSSQYLKLLSFNTPSIITDIHSSNNNVLRLLTENDINYSDYGLSVFLSWFQCYLPDFSDTLWISQQLGFMEEGYHLTVSTCVSTNLGDNYILYFGEDYDQPDLPKLEIRDRLTGQIVLTQQTNIHPDYILRANDNSHYFIEVEDNSNNPDQYNVYQLENEIQVSCESNMIIGSTFALCNYPNPFNPETTINYQLPEDSEVELIIYNIRGQKVKTLLNDIKPAGEHSVIWDGRDYSDKSVSSGIYFYKLKTKEDSQIRKMILLR